jgi:cation:H+ antiporter
MLVQFALFALGLGALVAGAELLVRGASRLALSFGISPLVVGLTVVAFGTSAPEVAVSVGSALKGEADIALGNVVGSNIFNVLFILGLSAVIAPLVVNAQLVRQEVPVMIGASVLLGILAWDGAVSRADGAALFVLLFFYTGFLVVQSRRASSGTKAEYAEEQGDGAPGRIQRFAAHRGGQVLLIAAGLLLLVAGSRWLVGAAVAFAQAIGVSELVIGLTIVAAGTSLPEVATSIMATIRGERDIAVGNVVGSNTFNILGCLGLSAVVAPDGLAVAPSILAFDGWVLLATAVACLPVFFTGRRIDRWEGIVFLGYYAAYTAYLVLAAQHHDALPVLSGAMLGFVVPLTVLTLGIALYRERATRRAAALRT